MKEAGTYDYIIAGGGLAGLSLLYHILLSPSLREMKILVIDQDSKNKNDRTWCFWENAPGPFEEIVHKRWNTLEFKNEDFSKQFLLEEYTYKMIRGIDFYNFVLSEAQQHANVTFVKEEILAISVESKGAIISTASHIYRAAYVFNSTSIFHPEMSTKNTLLQHFMGWNIRTDVPSFNPEVGTLMDFSLAQRHGTTFMYVLPVSEHEALVEYTLFTPETLTKEEYSSELERYIKTDLSISSYEITHQEYGVIPMSMEKFPRHFQQRIINIGTAGGHTKASSGYTFQFIQKEISAIVERLTSGEKPVASKGFRNKMFSWYDTTLLDVMIDEKRDGKYIFSRLFQKIDPETILRFLANESKFSEELRIMLSLTSMPFIIAGIKQLGSKTQR